MTVYRKLPGNTEFNRELCSWTNEDNNIIIIVGIDDQESRRVVKGRKEKGLLRVLLLNVCAIGFAFRDKEEGDRNAILSELPCTGRNGESGGLKCGRGCDYYEINFIIIIIWNRNWLQAKKMRLKI